MYLLKVHYLVTSSLVLVAGGGGGSNNGQQLAFQPSIPTRSCPSFYLFTPLLLPILLHHHYHPDRRPTTACDFSVSLPFPRAPPFQLRKTTTAVASFTMAATQEYTYQDVAEHNHKKDLFLVIHDKVYDGTKFVDEHP